MERWHNLSKEEVLKALAATIQQGKGCPSEHVQTAELLPTVKSNKDRKG